MCSEMQWRSDWLFNRLWRWCLVSSDLLQKPRYLPEWLLFEIAQFLNDIFVGCPCYSECPQGCPCKNWDCACGLDNKDQNKCMNYLQQGLNKCINTCVGGDVDCNGQCASSYTSEIDNCPCNANCPNGCPCPAYDCNMGVDHPIEVDMNPQRFPESKFVTFDELFDGTLSYTRGPSTFSRVNPACYICYDKGYWCKDIDSYESEDDCSKNSIPITKQNFHQWRSDNGLSLVGLSADEKYILAYKNYQKQWRHSFFADYFIYDVVNDIEITYADIRKS